MSKPVQIPDGAISPVAYSVAIAFGILCGYFILPPIFIAVVFVALSGVCIFFAFQNDTYRLFTLLPFMVYSEIFIRGAIHAIPYLYMQYVLITIFLILFTRKGFQIRVHSKAFMFFILFSLIEVIDIFRTSNPDYARGIITNTLVLTTITLWGSSNFLSPRVLNRLLNYIKLGSIFLCGIILAKHIRGGISYGTDSSSEAMNGLAPVQISGYLGVSCSIFFLSVMSDDEKKYLWLNFILLGLTSILLLLSFSRGGIYFLGAVMIEYFIFNRTKAKSYLLSILLLPLGFLVFSYVSETTNGAIENRYSEEGSSGRDVLVEVGFKLFSDEPLAGVGTGNFGSEIKKRNLYAVDSGAHNEFLRVMAEHGILGLITYWGFFLVLFIEILGRQKIPREYSIYFLSLFCLITIHNGLKISAQPMVLLIAIATPSLVRVKKRKYVQPAPGLAFKSS